MPDTPQRLPARSAVARPFLAAAAAAFVVVVPLLVWGYPRTGHDFNFHLCSWIDVARQWREGVIFPRWAALANHGYGEPRFIFYPPASWLMGAALSLFLPWKLVPGVFVWLVLVMAGMSMFVLAKEWLPPRYAVVAALAYVTNPYHLLLVYWRWAVAELLVSAVFPLVLLFAFRLRESGHRAALGLALVFALTWLANAPGAVIVTYTLTLLVVALALHAHRPRILAAGAAALALGLALAAFYFVPATLEQRWVHIDNALLPPLRPYENFVTLSPDHSRRPMALAAANVILGIALVAAVARRRRNLPNVWPPVALLAGVAAVLTLSISAPLWRYMPKLAFVQFPWRWLFVENAACALLLAFILTTLRRKPRAVLVSFALVFFLIVAGVAHVTHGDAGRVTATSAAIGRDGGYDGVPEYTPLGARLRWEGDESSLWPSSPLRSESVTLTTDSAAAGTLRLPLTWYPAWRAEVNGSPVLPHNQAGQVALPVAAGPAVIRVYFGRTHDRFWGGVVSLVALATVVLLATTRRWANRAKAAKTHEFIRDPV